MKKRIRIDAPAHMDRLEIAEQLVGPHMLLKAEHRPPQTKQFAEWQILNDLYERALRIYNEQIDRMVRAVQHSLGISDLNKAIEPLLTPDKLREVAQIISDYHTALLVNFGMGAAVDEEVLKRLVAQNIIPAEAEDIIGNAYLFGELVASVREQNDRRDLKKMRYEEFKQALRYKPIALTDLQRRAIEWSKQSAAIHIKGLGNRWADQFGKTAIEADAQLRRRLQSTVQDELAQNIDLQQSVRKLALELGNTTQDYSRDFGRIAATEKQQAFQEGFAAQLQESEGPAEAIYVAKLPAPTACPECVRLHLTDGLGSKPRIFRLSELIANGSNRGLKQRDWRAVIPPIHPFCQCELIHIPDGWDFESKPSRQAQVIKQQGREAWQHESGMPWRPRLLPDTLRRGNIFERDLIKSFMSYKDVPETGCVVRIGDPEISREVQAVIDQTPAWLFDKKVGVTLVTWDHPRPQVPLDEHDLAYWTGNEIRLSQHVKPDKVQRIMRHELGHALNVYLVRKLGSEKAVRAWHDKLFAIGQVEGYVSAYAGTAPIECAAEDTRLYLYDRQRLILRYPRQFAFLHAAYRELGKTDVDHTDEPIPQATPTEPEWAKSADRRFQH